jgi:hypothetical protein
MIPSAFISNLQPAMGFRSASGFLRNADQRGRYPCPSGQPDGDAGDPYNGYDRFGRTVDIHWSKPIG